MWGVEVRLGLGRGDVRVLVWEVRGISWACGDVDGKGCMINLVRVLESWQGKRRV